jgi:poly(A) polymerase/tRNA nucleotidyltransferase (CCA-adding enzyme)
MDMEGRIELGREIREWEKSVLEEGDLALVGGSVRDMLLGSFSSADDLDYIVSGLNPERLVAILGRYGKTDLVGRSFGVIKFTARDGETADICLPRREISTGTGHRDFLVDADPSIPVEQDLIRRDFTVNSMALDLRSMELIDPLGGLEDLDRRILRANSDRSFTEDPLRILRGVQFMGRFGLRAEERTAGLMRRDAPLIKTVSPERIRMELDKLLLLASSPGEGFVFMHENRILEIVLPELEETWGVLQNEFHPDDVFFHSIRSCDMAPRVLHLRLAALFHDLGKKKMKRVVDGRTVFYRHEEESARVAERVMERLKYSNDMVARVAHLVRNHMFFMTDDWSDSAVRRFIARIGPGNIEDILSLRLADGRSRGDGMIFEEVESVRERVRRILAESSAFRREDLAVTGRDVMETMGIGPGKKVGLILESLVQAVLDNPEYNNRERLIELMNRKALE